MSRRQWLPGGVLVACILGLVTARADDPGKGGDVWLSDYEQARKVARETDRPIFVVFRCEH